MLTDAEAGVSVEFSKEDAIVFKANTITHHVLENKAKVEQELIELLDQRKWKTSYVIVTEVLEAGSATVLISNSKTGKIELKADAGVQAGELDIADANLNFQVVRNKGIGIEIIANAGLTPLYRLSAIQGKRFGLFGSAQMVERDISDEPDQLLEVPFNEEEMDLD